MKYFLGSFLQQLISDKIIFHHSELIIGGSEIIGSLDMFYSEKALKCAFLCTKSFYSYFVMESPKIRYPW